MGKIKAYIRKIPFLYTFLKIIKDKRYLYHYLQGYITNRNIRSKLSKLESKVFFRNNNPSFTNPKIENINKEGFFEGVLKIKDEEIQEICDYLKNKPMHDPENQELDYFYLNNRPSQIKRGFYKCEDVVLAPHVLDIANDPRILDIVSEYFGAMPSIDYIGSWWSFPSKNIALTQSYHRDIDTLNSLKFFIYLTDVDEGSGPFVYVKGSHNSDLKTKKDKMHKDNEILNSYNDEDVLEFKGKKGHNFIADTFGFHKGLAPKNSDRLILQIIYTLKRTPFGPKKPFVNFGDVEKKSKQILSHYTNRHIIRF